MENLNKSQLACLHRRTSCLRQHRLKHRNAEAAVITVAKEAKDGVSLHSRSSAAFSTVYLYPSMTTGRLKERGAP